MEAALSGEGPTPWSWFISQLCETFGTTPLTVLRELGYQMEAVPGPVLTEILEFRSYRNARDALVRAEDQNNTLFGPMYDLVRETRARVQRARLGPLFDQMDANQAL